MTGSDFATLEPLDAPHPPAPTAAERVAAPTTGTQRMRVDGRAVVLKRSSGRLRSRARAEADVLARLGTAPVVELIARRETDDTTDLVLGDAGPDDLALKAASCDTDLERLNVWLAATARALGDLHDLGWSHGALCAEHVVVADDGSVRLCSLGSAQPTLHDGPAMVADRRELLALIAGCATAWIRCGSDVRDQRKRSRCARRLQRIVSELSDRRTLPDARAVATRLEGELATTRVPTRAQLAERTATRIMSVRAAGPRHRRALAAVAERARGLQHRGRDRRVRAAAAVGIAVAVVAGWSVLPLPTGPTAQPGQPGQPGQVAPTESTGSADPHGGSSAVRPLGATCPSAGSAPGGGGRSAEGGGADQRELVDLDGDGCVEPVQLEGRTVEVASTWYELGTPGDLVALADDDCDGVWSIVLLRPSSGELFEFSELAATDRPLDGRLRGAIPGAADLRVPSDAAGAPSCGPVQLADAEDVDLGPAP